MSVPLTPGEIAICGAHLTATIATLSSDLACQKVPPSPSLFAAMGQMGSAATLLILTILEGKWTEGSEDGAEAVRLMREAADYLETCANGLDPGRHMEITTSYWKHSSDIRGYAERVSSA